MFAREMLHHERHIPSEAEIAYVRRLVAALEAKFPAPPVRQPRPVKPFVPVRLTDVQLLTELEKGGVACAIPARLLRARIT